MSNASESLHKRRFQIADFAPLITLCVLTLVFSLVADGFVSINTVSTIMNQGAVLTIAAVGMTFVLLCGEIDLSVGTVALLSSCICGVLWESSFAAGPKEIKGPDTVSAIRTILVFLIPLVTAFVLGTISGWLTVSSGLPSFIITLAFMNIAMGLSRFLTLGEQYSMPPFLNRLGKDYLVELNLGILGALSIPQSAVAAGMVLLAAHVVLQHTRFGRYVYMTGGNRQAARLAGVRTERIVIACLAICATTAAFGGMITAGRIGKESLDLNSDLLLDSVACVVLGGTSLFGGEGGIGRTLVGVSSFMVLKVGLNLTSIKRLVKGLPIPPSVRDSWLDSRWVTEFESLRPFVLGIVLMLALVIQGRLAKNRADS